MGGPDRGARSGHPGSQCKLGCLFGPFCSSGDPRGTDFGSPPLPAAEPHTAALTDANLEDPSHPGVRRAMAGLYRMFGSPPSRRRARGHSNRDEGSPSRRLSGPGSVMRDSLLRRSEASSLVWSEWRTEPAG